MVQLEVFGGIVSVEDVEDHGEHENEDGEENHENLQVLYHTNDHCDDVAETHNNSHEEESFR